jgi:hypothetical protein
VCSVKFRNQSFVIYHLTFLIRQLFERDTPLNNKCQMTNDQ